jgi:hypothetical protein
MSRWRVLLFGLVAAYLAFAGVARANLVNFSCPSDCSGNLYAVWLVSHVANTYVLEYDIEVLSTYTGNLASDVVNAVEIKSFVSSYNNEQLVMAPAGVVNWNLVHNELNANGCAGGANGNRLCAEAKSPYAGAPLSGTVPKVLSWQFQFDSTQNLNSTAHVKYLYNNSDGKKAKNTGLGSFDLDIQVPPQVPEPAGLVLFGTGLLGLAALVRKNSLNS